MQARVDEATRRGRNRIRSILICTLTLSVTFREVESLALKEVESVTLREGEAFIGGGDKG